MLRFFRHIRQRLFLEGRVSRYFGYAVGEIVLIVVGILIALQINDWNEGRKLKQERINLIENLSEEFQTNLERVEETLSVAETTTSKLKHFLSVATTENSHLSVKELRASSDLDPITFRPALGTYQGASNDGSISLLKNPALIELIVNFEQNYNYYLINQNLDRESIITGEVIFLRRRLGSLAVFLDTTSLEAPEAYLLSDSQYRELIAEKEVYSFFETMYQLKNNQTRRLQNVKEITVEILARLEKL
jgi:hypothetical protein